MLLALQLQGGEKEVQVGTSRGLHRPGSLVFNLHTSKKCTCRSREHPLDSRFQLSVLSDQGRRPPGCCVSRRGFCCLLEQGTCRRGCLS